MNRVAIFIIFVFVDSDPNFCFWFFLSGLVLGLNEHKDEYSDIYLSHYSTYILVEKQAAEPTEDNTSLPNYVLYFKTALPFCPNFKFAFLSPSLLWIRIKVTKFLDSEKVPTNRKTRKRNGERPNFKSALYYTNNCTYNIYVIKIGWWSEALIMICDAIFPEQIICFVLITITFRAV